MAERRWLENRHNLNDVDWHRFYRARNQGGMFMARLISADYRPRHEDNRPGDIGVTRVLPGDYIGWVEVWRVNINGRVSCERLDIAS